MTTLTPSTAENPQAIRRKFILASRASELARIQTNIVRNALEARHPSTAFEALFMSTGGDKNQSQALYLLGGKALWTEELEVALRAGEVDMLVHSFKDVPTELPEGCEIAGVLKREDPVDSLVVKKGETWKSLDELPDGSVVGTSSVRRVAQLKRRFPRLVFKDVVSFFLFVLGRSRTCLILFPWPIHCKAWKLVRTRLPLHVICSSSSRPVLHSLGTRA